MAKSDKVHKEKSKGDKKSGKVAKVAEVAGVVTNSKKDTKPKGGKMEVVTKRKKDKKSKNVEEPMNVEKPMNDKKTSVKVPKVPVTSKEILEKAVSISSFSLILVPILFLILKKKISSNGKVRYHYEVSPITNHCLLD